MMECWEIKRFLEWWTADARFRDAVERDPWGTVRAHGLEVDPEACRPLHDRAMAALQAADVHPAVQAYREFILAKLRHRAELQRRAATSNLAFAAWRRRQMARYFTQVGRLSFASNCHLPWAMELTRGCAEPCPFCAFNVGPLRAVARFTPENERLFRGVLRALHAFFGDATETGFLYYASEPLDNSDYERYLHAFYEELGVTPQTTTAAWHRNLDRTRRVLAQSRAEAGWVNRFTVNSLPLLERCMASFSAEELEDVELIVHAPGSRQSLVKAGRGAAADPEATGGTVACVTGFCINLPERTVRLVSPSTDLERWPQGEMVFASGSFGTAEDLAAFLADCEARVLAWRPGDDFVPRFRPDLEVADGGTDRLEVRTPSWRLTLRGELLHDVALAVDGARTVDGIVDALEERHDAAPVYHTLRSWWRGGFLCEPVQAGPRP